MVDLSRDQHGKVRARLLDLVPGRSGKVYADWLKARNQAFRDGIGVATLDPFHGYKNAIDDELEDAVAVLDAFHVVKLGTRTGHAGPTPRHNRLDHTNASGRSPTGRSRTVNGRRPCGSATTPQLRQPSTVPVVSTISSTLWPTSAAAITTNPGRPSNTALVPQLPFPSHRGLSSVCVLGRHRS